MNCVNLSPEQELRTPDLKTADLVTASMDAWYALGELDEALNKNIAANQTLIPSVTLAEIKAMVAVIQGLLAALADSLHREELQAGWDSLTPEQKAECTDAVENLKSKINQRG